MAFSRRSRCSLALALFGFGCGSAQTRSEIGSDLGERAATDTAEAGAPSTAPLDEKAAPGTSPSAQSDKARDAAAPEHVELPRYSPEQKQSAADRSAEAPDQRARLGLRLAAIDQGPDAPWVIALVNRGTETLRVRPDLRLISLEVTPPAPAEQDAKKKQKPAPKVQRCALPKDIVPREEDSSPELTLAPGEGLLDSFDPRLYCLPNGDKSALVPGASVVVHLGWPEKTKRVWKKGKSEIVVQEQTAPFVARRDIPEGALPEAAASKSELADANAAPASDQVAVKELVTRPIVLGNEYAKQPEPADPAPLRLELSHHSDASTERDALLTVTITNRSKKPQRLLFRRELISFEISGPDGLVACEPGPDDRAPDRMNITTVRPGRSVRATSRLIELCPQGALRRPGLYLVHARFDSDVRGTGAQGVFDGRLLSHKPAVLRVRRGWGTLPPEHEPERFHIGAP